MERGMGKQLLIRSYLQVFVLQSILLVLVSTPVIYVSSVRNPPLAYSDVVGVLVWDDRVLFRGRWRPSVTAVHRQSA